MVIKDYKKIACVVKNDWYTKLSPEIATPLREHIRYYQVKRIPQDLETYLYIINADHVRFFERNINIGFKELPELIVNDVQNGKAKIVILQPTEGDSGTWHSPEDFHIIQNWIKEINIPAKQVYYVNGNLRSKECVEAAKVDFNTIGVSCFENWMKTPSSEPLVKFEPEIKNNLYLNLNRRVRVHRLYLLAELLNSKLFDKGQNSYNIKNSEVVKDLEKFNNFIEFYDKDLVESAKYLYINQELILDVETTPNLALNVNKELYKNTFVSLVTETVISNNSTFLSEKTWKPISVGHPFMILGGSYTLKVLKERGFKTFDKWFDESYDYAPTLKEKIIIIIKNLERYKNHTPEQLQALRQEMKEVCIHNQNILKQRVEKLYKENGQHFFSACSVATKPILDTLYDVYHNW